VRCLTISLQGRMSQRQTGHWGYGRARRLFSLDDGLTGCAVKALVHSGGIPPGNWRLPRLFRARSSGSGKVRRKTHPTARSGVTSPDAGTS
jgi:hypothetical protein